MKRMGLLVAGFKGLNFLRSIVKHGQPAFVSSYDDAATLDSSFADIKQICSEHSIRFVGRDSLDRDVLAGADIIMVVGWQHLIPDCDERFVIFHDSILPRYRGFAPTVSALINGEPEIGVTALRPVAEVDRGPVYGSLGVPVTYPVRIRDVFMMLNEKYVELAVDIMERLENGSLAATPQDESLATYSLWRDELDYIIDWSWPSAKILRFIYAVGWPYKGAMAAYRGRRIIINEARLAEDMTFEGRAPGKLWSVQGGEPLVVCGEGMLQILKARYEDGEPVVFSSVRQRLNIG